MSDVAAAIKAARTPTRKVEIAKTAFDRGLIGRAEFIAAMASAKRAKTRRFKPWKPWEDAIIRDGLQHGACYETISHRLPDRTRNACLGRARRLGLCVPDVALMLHRKPAHRPAPVA